VYGKIFEQIYDGSLRLNWKAMITFQQMIVLCSEEGIVDLTPDALHFRTGIPLDIIKDGIKILENDDPESRSPNCNGKRIERLDEHRTWGWHIVNHKYYRDMINREDKNKRDRERMRAIRAEQKAKEISSVAKCSQPSQSVRDVAHTDADANTDKEKIYKKEKVEKATQFPPEFKLTPELKTYAIQKGIPEQNVRDCFEHFENHHRAKGSTMKDWSRAWYTWVQKAKTFNPIPTKDSTGSSSPTADKKFNEFMRVMKL